MSHLKRASFAQKVESQSLVLELRILIATMMEISGNYGESFVTSNLRLESLSIIFEHVMTISRPAG
jgi:hypothetical protein